jgi:hypothetical protein
VTRLAALVLAAVFLASGVGSAAIPDAAVNPYRENVVAGGLRPIEVGPSDTLHASQGDAGQEQDLDHCAVYRDTVEDFELAMPIGLTTGATCEDDDPPDAPEWWYKVTAWDVNGNEAALAVSVDGQ